MSGASPKARNRRILALILPDLLVELALRQRLAVAPELHAEAHKPLGVVLVNEPEKAERSEKSKQPPKSKPRGVGKLIASSSPVAAVWVDGKDTGRVTPIAPIKPLELSAGEHTIEFRAQDGRKASVKFSVVADQVNKLTGVQLQ